MKEKSVSIDNVDDGVFIKNKVTVISSEEEVQRKIRIKPAGRTGKNRNFPKAIEGGYAFKGAWSIENHDLKEKFYSKAKQIGNIDMLWHGSDRLAGPRIAIEGMLVGRMGMFGGGIYFGKRRKAELYKPDKKAHLLVCKVALGKSYKALDQMYNMNYSQLQAMGFDSVHGVKDKTKSWGGTLCLDEWVVYDEAQVLPMYVGVYERKESQQGLDFWTKKYYRIDDNNSLKVFRCAYCGRIFNQKIDLALETWKPCMTVSCSSCLGRTIFDREMTQIWVKGDNNGKIAKKKKKKNRKTGRKRK